MITFEITPQGLKQGMTLARLGAFPTFMSEQDQGSAREQIDFFACGGWQKFRGFSMGKDGSLSYPGDPDMKPLAKGWLRDERIFVYEFDWVAIVQPDGTFEVARIA